RRYNAQSPRASHSLVLSRRGSRSEDANENQSRLDVGSIAVRSERVGVVAGEAQGHHRSGCAGTRRQRSAIDDGVNSVAADPGAGNNRGDWRWMAEGRGGAYVAHA